MATPTHQKLPRRHAYAAAILVSLATLSWLTSSSANAWRSPGGDGDIHVGMACEACHLPAPGTLRQQIQAQLRHLLGRREQGTVIGYLQPSDKDCSACHENPDDPHAAWRFLEPRFREAREAIRPEHCASCHSGHGGKQVLLDGAYCVECHQGLSRIDDPVQPTHEELVETQRWETCLQCHDYHGNHKFEEPLTLEDAIPLETIEGHLSGEQPSPYGELIHPYETFPSTDAPTPAGSE